MKVSHIITGLGQGGAEGALVRLICESKDPAAHTVISLMGEGVHAEALRATGVHVITLDAPRGRFSISAFHRLILAVRESSPDVVQTWMYHADLLGGLAAKWLGIPVVWGVRHSDNSINDLGLKTWIVTKICSLLSYWIPELIVGCSRRAIDLHQAFGYSSRFVYIPNGFDFTKPIDSVVLSFLHEPPVFGHAARLHPIKDHANFLKAMDRLIGLRKSFRALMAGSGILLTNPLFRAIFPEDMKRVVSPVGPQNDMSSFYASLDCFVLSSKGEAFPNVVAEAMLAGIPCIVTDVGDAAEIVGDTGWVVPPRNADALANAMVEALDAMKDSEAWMVRKAKARARIVAEYSMAKMQSRYQAAWKAAMES